MTTIGIRLEDKNHWERRVPLVPTDIAPLIQDHGLRVIVQPSPQRTYGDDAFRAIGAEVDMDLSSADVVFAVKEIPVPLITPERTYVFFAHVIKGQPYNMHLLRHLLDSRSTLIDYERIVDDQGKRLVLFGREAGEAGMIDSLHLLGRRFALEGLDTPFAEIRLAHDYSDLSEAKEQLEAVGANIRRGMASTFESTADLPLVFGFMGGGNVSQGAQEIFDILPFEEVAPEDLQTVCAQGPAIDDRLIKVRFGRQHLATPKDPTEAFDKETYSQHPERFRGRLAEFLPHVSVLMNGIYWTPEFPRFFSRAEAQDLWSRGERKLRLIGDVTCDIDGAIELTYKATSPDDPAYVYAPSSDSFHAGIEGDGIIVLAVDNLPCELPRDASNRFSHSLRSFVPSIARADYSKPFEDLTLPPEIHRAVITHRGELTPNYEYLASALSRAEQEHAKD